MNNKKTLLILIAVFVLLVVGASVLYDSLGDKVDTNPLVGTGQSSETDTSQENDSQGENKTIAPDFVVYDGEGNEVKLSDSLGKPVILNFWASWCGPCMIEMPDFQEKYEAYGSDIQFLMINMTDGGRETIETATAFIEKEGYTFPVVFDTEGEAGMTYGAYSIPMTFFIDSEGYVAAYARGALDGETLQKGIDMVR